MYRILQPSDYYNQLSYFIFIESMHSSNLQKEATQDLRFISENPWIIQQKNNHQKQIKPKCVQQFINTKITFRDRPNTHQSKRQKSFFDQKSPLRILKTYEDSRRNTSVRLKPFMSKMEEYKLSNQIVPLTLSNQIRTRSEMREKKINQKRNYSQLRKTFETGFFIGKKDKERQKQSVSMHFPSKIATDKKLEESKNNTVKNLKKGRLWLGRPVLLFQPAQH